MKRTTIILVGIGIFWAILLIKIFSLSILEHKEHKKQAKSNTIKEEIIIPIRGEIVDRNGVPLATNKISFAIAFPPKMSLRHQLPTLEKELERLLEFFPETSKEELLARYKKADSPYNHDFISVIDSIEHSFILQNYPRLKQSEYLKVLPQPRRFYPNTTSASHIIGYVSKANDKDTEKQPITKHTKNIGKEGLERQYDTYLQGELGINEVQVTALNKEIGRISSKEPIENRTLVTTLDIEIQKRMDEIFKNLNGAAIIMDAHSGEILAAGSYPEYDLNLFVDGISYENWNAIRDNPYKPLINKIINGLYPPGSVIKMGVGLGILEHVGIDENKVIETPPFIELGGRKFRDWKKEGHQESDFYKSLKRSVDVYYYLLSQKTDFENIANTLKQLGLGEPTGVDLPREFKGIVPSPSFKKERYKENWYTGDSVVSSIGQGMFLTTPLQIANYTATMVTGKQATPHFAKYIDGKEITKENKETLNDFQKSKLGAIREGMRQVCGEVGGTAFYATREAKVSLACKTGTAQVVGISQEDKERIKEKDMEYFMRSQAWITGFLPVNTPRYVITVMVEHGGSGSSAGGPILAKLANVLVDLGYVKKDKD